MAEKVQKTQKEWELQWKRGKYTVRDLYDKGFRPRSNRGRMAVYEYRYYKRHYSIVLILSPEDYQELKSCPYQIEQEQEEKQDREEWERYQYLKSKYGGGD